MAHWTWYIAGMVALTVAGSFVPRQCAGRILVDWLKIHAPLFGTIAIAMLLPIFKLSSPIGSLSEPRSLICSAT